MSLCEEIRKIFDRNDVDLKDDRTWRDFVHNIRDEVLASLPEVYPEDFENFFKAMVEEMKRHDAEKGLSWKHYHATIGRHYRYDTVGIPITEPMGEYLSKLLQKAHTTWRRYGDLHQLVDIANICAMIWSRKE